MEIEMIKELLNDQNAKMLSLYLNVDPALRENQASTPAWRIELKNMLKKAEKEVGDDALDDWAVILGRVDGFFDNYTADTKALAIFFTPEDEYVFQLPLPIESQYAFGEPLLMPLLWALDEYKRYLIVLVDRENAKFLTAFLGSAHVEDTMEIALDTEDWRERPIMPVNTANSRMAESHTSSSHPTQGSQVDEYEDRLAEHTERFYKEVIAEIEKLCKEKKCDRIILGGHDQSAHAVRRLMSEQLAGHVVDVMAIPMRTAPNEVAEMVLPSALDYERNYEMTLLDEVINLAKSGGRGALGHEDVMEAMRQQRVELLIVPRSLSSDELKTQLPIEIINSSGELEIVHGEAAQRLLEEGELAARLYYAI